MDFDIAVIGLGAMGSAATRALAKAGARVVGFDQHHPPHSLGSTHGHTRIIREAYYEHPLYVPLVRRAYELWAELETESSQRLLHVTGGLMAGPASGPLVRGALESARAHDIAHEVVDAGAIAARFPAFAPRPEWVGVVERRAGMLLPERCVDAMLAGARSAGAALRVGIHVHGWRANGRSVRLETSDGHYDVDRVVVAAGPWLPDLHESLGQRLPLLVERQLSHWFAPVHPADPRWAPERTPIALWEVTDDGEVFATFPNFGPGVKCGMHHAGSFTSPDVVNRVVSDAENDAARSQLDAVMPGAAGRLVESRVCLYTNTPDRHFIIDWMAGGRVLVVSPCSGHGFKFASAIGELAQQLVMDDRAWIDITPFSLSRFA